MRKKNISEDMKKRILALRDQDKSYSEICKLEPLGLHSSRTMRRHLQVMTKTMVNRPYGDVS